MSVLRPYKNFIFLLRPYWRELGLSFFIDNFLQIGVLLPPLILRVLFDYVYPYRDFSLLVIFLGLPFVLAIIFQLLIVLRSFLDLYTSQQVFKSLYRLFYSKVQRLPMTFHQHHKPGDLLYRMTDDMHTVEEVLLTSIPKFFSAVIKILVLLALCFSMNIQLTVLALIGVPLYFVQTHL